MLISKLVVRRSLIALVIAASFAGVATAQSGSWNADANGNWGDTTKWTSGIPASGSGFAATFANDITGDRTVTLDSARTLTNLTFGDASTSTAGGWTIAGSGSNTLNLAGTTPTITVNALGAGLAAGTQHPVRPERALSLAGSRAG